MERHLKARGLTVYRPPARRSHPIDFLVIDPENRVWSVDVKTYPRRTHYADTGIDTRDWVKYCRLAEKNAGRVLIYFVDLVEETVYRYQITDALKAIAYESQGKTYFPLSGREVVIPQIGEESLKALRAAQTGE